MLDVDELVDNEFLRQFELKIENQLATIEYSSQDRKLFLTKLVIPEDLSNENFSNEFIKLVLDSIKERNLSVMPTSPEIAKFIRRNKIYKSMLPVGVRI